jgi:hypothetical protein
MIGTANGEDADDSVWLSKQVPMYVNHPSPDHKDNLKVEYPVWEGFGPTEVAGTKTVWAFADYQRNLGGVKNDHGEWVDCVVFEVNNVEYLKKLNDPRLRVHATMYSTCEGVDKWIKEELNNAR